MNKRLRIREELSTNGPMAMALRSAQTNLDAAWQAFGRIHTLNEAAMKRAKRRRK